MPERRPGKAGTLRQRMEGEQPLERRAARGQRADRRLVQIDVGVAFVREHREVVLVGEREQRSPIVFARRPRLRDWTASRYRPPPCAPASLSAATHSREGSPSPPSPARTPARRRPPASPPHSIDRTDWAAGSPAARPPSISGVTMNGARNSPSRVPFSGSRFLSGSIDARGKPKRRVSHAAAASRQSARAVDRRIFAELAGMLRAALR